MSEPLLLIERQAGEPLEAAVLNALADTMASDHGLPNLSKIEATVRRYYPVFYGDVDLIEISAEDWTPRNARLYYLHSAGKFYRLDGTSPPIHAINAVADIGITAATALEYLAFFCFFVRSEEGPFLIADRLDNRYLPPIANTAELRGAFRKPVLWGQDQNGDWRASALVYHGDSLFFADFLIHLNGMVEMKDDQNVVSGTGKKVDAPLKIDGVRND